MEKNKYEKIVNGILEEHYIRPEDAIALQELVGMSEEVKLLEIALKIACKERLQLMFNYRRITDKDIDLASKEYVGMAKEILESDKQ